MATNVEPTHRSWPILFGGFIESLNEQQQHYQNEHHSAGVGNNNNRNDLLLALLEEAKLNGKLTTPGQEGIVDGDQQQWQWPHRLELDCTALKLIDPRGGDATGHGKGNDEEGGHGKELLAVVPMHQLASVGFVRHQPPNSALNKSSANDSSSSTNLLALKVGDIVDGAPELFDLLLVYTPSAECAREICQHFVHCFQFLYREAIAEMEEEKEADGDQQQRQLDDFAKKFVPVVASSASEAASLCSSAISALRRQQRQKHGAHHHRRRRASSSADNDQAEVGEEMLRSAGSPIGLGEFAGKTAGKQTAPASGTSTATSSTASTHRHALELINEYLTMLSACLSHEELNKFAILMRRWRAREMPILEFAQKLLELYGPERRHLLARMRSLLRGDPTDLDALSDFLRANGVVEDAAATLGGDIPSPLTADMSLSELTGTISSCPPSTASSFNTQASTASSASAPRIVPL